MWIVWTLAGFAVLLYLGYAWLAALVTKYEHTSHSLTLLTLLGAASVYLGIRLANQVAPAWTGGPKAAIAGGVAFTLFNILSFISVNLWCSLLTRKYDDRMAALEEEEDAILRELDSSRWRALRQAEFRSSAAQAVSLSRHDEERAALRKAVETWEQGGGAARIRSVKVLEWKEALKDKSMDALREDLMNVELEARSDPDEARREQARAHAALLSLEIMEREGPPKAADPQPAHKLPEDEGRARERLQAIQVEIEAERRAKAEFMRKRIRLSWRADK
ncbi:MAG: hypothetical protein ACM3WU_08540 [Bacillota bacterium]